uniref:Fibroblast growth factor n=1 Tax=Ciona savignyi TaxID=51511 RepID=Q8T8A3_CIOSA|nr:fibroblast growth factor 9/16/20 [Ciona savignyi]
MSLISNMLGLSSNVPQAATGTNFLSSLLLAAVARARGKVIAGHSQIEAPSSGLENSMPRIEAAKVRSLFPAKLGRRRRQPSSLESNSPVPQKLTEDTMPVVHDRFPDLTLWKKIEDDMKVQEKKLSLGLPSHSQNTRSKRNIYPFMQKYDKDTPQVTMRRKMLYCKNGYNIQILPNGRISGTQESHSEYAVLEFISTGVGSLTIRGVASGLYLAMNSKGRLYGSETFTHESIFYESVLENKQNTFESFAHRSGSRRCYIALGRHGRPKQGCRVHPNNRHSQFLPRNINVDRVKELYMGRLY